MPDESAPTREVTEHPYPLAYTDDGERIDPPGDAVGWHIFRKAAASANGGGRPSVVKRKGRPFVLKLDAPEQALLDLVEDCTVELRFVDKNEKQLKSAPVITIEIKGTDDTAPAASAAPPAPAPSAPPSRDLLEAVVTLAKTLQESITSKDKLIEQLACARVGIAPQAQATAAQPVAQPATASAPVEEEKQMDLQKLVADAATAVVNVKQIIETGKALLPLLKDKGADAAPANVQTSAGPGPS